MYLSYIFHRGRWLLAQPTSLLLYYKPNTIEIKGEQKNTSQNENIAKQLGPSGEIRAAFLYLHFSGTFIYNIRGGDRDELVRLDGDRDHGGKRRVCERTGNETMDRGKEETKMNSWNGVEEYIKVLKQMSADDQNKVWMLAKACVGWPYIFGDRGQKCTPSHRKAVFNEHQDQSGLISKCQVLRSEDPQPDCSGCKWFPGGERVLGFDCRGFTYKMLLEIYGWKLQGTGATAQWNNEDNWAAKGTIDTIPEDTLVCLFYPDKKDPKRMAHTGLGFRGETVECSNGVQHFTKRDKKWTHWAVPVCLASGTTEPDAGTRPTLRNGSQGEYVKKLQTILIEKGYSCGKWGADGKFGAATENAVTLFQEKNGLEANGYVGPETWAALEGGPTTLYTVHVPHLTKFQAEALIERYMGSSMTEEGR